VHQDPSGKNNLKKSQILPMKPMPAFVNLLVERRKEAINMRFQQKLYHMTDKINFPM